MKKLSFYKLTILMVLVCVAAIFVLKELPSDLEDKNSPSIAQETSILAKRKSRDLQVEKIDKKFSDRYTKDPYLINPSTETYSVEDINAMIEVANLIEDNEEHGQALKRIAHLWTLIDPDACLQWSLSIANENVGYKYVTAHVISTLVGSNQLEKSTQLLQDIPQGKLRDTAIGYSMFDFAEIDPNLAADLLTMISSSDQIRSSARVISNTLIELDRLSDIKDMYVNMPYGAAKENLGSAVVQGLVVKDPLKALDWIKDNPEINNVKSFESLAKSFAKLDPQLGITVAQEIVDPVIKKKYMSSLVAYWADKNPAEAGKWVIGQIDSVNFDENRDDFSALARLSLANDQNLLFSQLENIQDQTARNAATLSAAAALSEYNPSKAAELALTTTTEEPSEQADAIAITAKNWLNRDPLAASEWIRNLPAGSLKDTAVSELVDNILSKDRDIVMANAWADQIVDPTIRSKVNKSIDNFRE